MKNFTDIVVKKEFKKCYSKKISIFYCLFMLMDIEESCSTHFDYVTPDDGSGKDIVS